MILNFSLKVMIWPFNRSVKDDADLLVGAVNTFAMDLFPEFIDEFPSVPHDEYGQHYRVHRNNCQMFIALIVLRTLNLKGKRRLKLEKKVAACLLRLYPTIAASILKSISHFSTRPTMIFRTQLRIRTCCIRYNQEDR